MIKKHLIACSLMLILMFTARVLINNPPSNASNSLPQISIFKIKKPTITEKKPPTDAFIYSLSFANEDLPLGDCKVVYRMKKSLESHSFKTLQTKKLHQKAAKWFPVIEPILKSYGIPEDFKYIPLVESGLQEGTSPKGASGYWQFMPQTARNYGLQVSRHVDERQNVRKSTVAACRYIKSLFKEFNSWTLVAAAYNVGENKLKRQINRQNQDNYFKMKLNRETATYVYKLISMKEIIEHPVKYGYKKRPKQLLANVEETEDTFVNPIVERNALKALQLLRN